MRGVLVTTLPLTPLRVEILWPHGGPPTICTKDKTWYQEKRKFFTIRRGPAANMAIFGATVAGKSTQGMRYDGGLPSASRHSA